MKESLKYGLLTGLGYCAIVGVIHLVGLCLGYIAGGVDNLLYPSRLYLYFAVAGLCGSFICGVGFLHSIDRFPLLMCVLCLVGLYSFACISKTTNAIRTYKSNHIDSIKYVTYE